MLAIRTSPPVCGPPPGRTENTRCNGTAPELEQLEPSMSDRRILRIRDMFGKYTCHRVGPKTTRCNGTATEPRDWWFCDSTARGPRGAGTGGGTLWHAIEQSSPRVLGGIDDPGQEGSRGIEAALLRLRKNLDDTLFTH